MTAAAHLVVSACSESAAPVLATLLDGQHGMFGAATSQAAHIERLYWIIFWICAVVFVLVIAAFTRAAAKTRVKHRTPLPVITDEEGDRRAHWAVGAAVGVTVVSLFTVLVLDVITGKKVQGLTSKNPVTIQVTGHQWWWEVRYPDTEPDLTITTANEIHVPVGKPVVLLTQSADVIHSFWAPNLGGKRDLLPGYSSAYWFQVDKPGIYHGQCAEFCGLQHAHMGFSVVAESPENFAAWKSQQIESAAEPTDAERIRGREVFLTHSCVLCHTIQGTAAASRFGPDLTHVGGRQMIAAESLSNTTGSLAGWISDPQHVKPGNKMPANPLPPGDLQALVAYLHGLQ